MIIFQSFYLALKHLTIDYEKKLPLKEELKFFFDFIDGGDCKVADTGHAIDVMKILEKAGQQLVQKRIK